MSGASTPHVRPQAHVPARRVVPAALCVLYSWALVYATDLPLVLWHIPPVPFGVGALIASLAGAAALALRSAAGLLREEARPGGALAAALLALLASAAAHDLARHFSRALPPEATTSGLPRALLYAAVLYADAYAVLWARRTPDDAAEGAR